MDAASKSEALDRMARHNAGQWAAVGGTPLDARGLAQLRLELEDHFRDHEDAHRPPAPVPKCPDCGNLDPSPCSSRRCAVCCNRLCSDFDCRARDRA